MEKRRLGQSDIEITPIGLGCWQFANSGSGISSFWDELPQEEIDRIVAASITGGINWFDTAEAYETLINKFSYTHEALAKRICKDRTSITNQLRLLKLPDPIKEDLREQKLSMGHARTLLAIDNISAQLSLSSKVIKRKLSVRELEKIVQNYKNKKDKTRKTETEDSCENTRIENDLSSLLSTKVKLIKKPNNSGKLEIYFHSIDELTRLLDTLGLQEEMS